jgi:CCR4-NOT transcription complex subunit 7/8
MAPHNRYAQPSMNMGYSHLQPSHLPQQQHHQSQVHGALPPPNLNNPGFGPGSAASNSSPFAMTGGMNNGGFPDVGLSSHAAQMGFARGGPVQPQNMRDLDRMEISRRMNNGESRIRNVWAHNLKQEMKALRDLVEEYPYIAMARPLILPDETNAYYSCTAGH